MTQIFSRRYEKLVIVRSSLLLHMAAEIMCTQLTQTTDSYNLAIDKKKLYDNYAPPHRAEALSDDARLTSV